MIDTIRLFTKEYDLAPKNNFVRMETTDYSTGEMISEKVFCNLPSGARLNVKPQGSESCLFFEASLPKLIYKTSLKELQESDFERCIEQVGDHFEAAGAVIDRSEIENMAVSRLDFCRNIQVEHSIVDYLALLRNCSISKRSKANWQTETVLWYNGSQEFTAYNKVLEVKGSKQALALGIEPSTKEDILRLESRMKSAAVVKRILSQRRTFAECYNFKLAKEKLLTDFDGLVLNIGEQLQLNFLEDLERLQALRDKSRYSWQLFLSEYGTGLFLAKYSYDLELIKKLLLEAYSRRQAYNILKNLKLFIAEHRTPKERFLLRELREKLAA
jgi:hypothetical protein